MMQADVKALFLFKTKISNAMKTAREDEWRGQHRDLWLSGAKERAMKAKWI